MRRLAAVLLVFAIGFPSSLFGADENELAGYSQKTGQAERD